MWFFHEYVYIYIFLSNSENKLCFAQYWNNSILELIGVKKKKKTTKFKTSFLFLKNVLSIDHKNKFVNLVNLLQKKTGNSVNQLQHNNHEFHKSLIGKKNENFVKYTPKNSQVSSVCGTKINHKFQQFVVKINYEFIELVAKKVTNFIYWFWKKKKNCEYLQSIIERKWQISSSVAAKNQ